MSQLKHLNLGLDDAKMTTLSKIFPSIYHLISQPDDQALSYMDTIARLAIPPPPFPPSQLIISYVKNEFTPPIKTAKEEYDDLAKMSLRSTGCPPLDAMLRGGLREGQVTEFVGETRAGKTAMCMQIALCAAIRGDPVIYIDTCGGFSGRRVAALHAARQAASMPPPPSLEQSLNNITVLRAHDVFVLFQILEQMCVELQEAASEGSVVPLRVLIIDSISALLQGVITTTSHNAHASAVLQSLGSLLKALAHRYSVVIVTTNHMVGGGGGGALRPALGESWRAHPNWQIQLDPPISDRASVRKFTLLKSEFIPTGMSGFFCITDDGLHEVPNQLAAELNLRPRGDEIVAARAGLLIEQQAWRRLASLLLTRHPSPPLDALRHLLSNSCFPPHTTYPVHVQKLLQAMQYACHARPDDSSLFAAALRLAPTDANLDLIRLILFFQLQPCYLSDAIKADRLVVVRMLMEEYGMEPCLHDHRGASSLIARYIQSTPRSQLYSPRSLASFAHATFPVDALPAPALRLVFHHLGLIPPFPPLIQLSLDLGLPTQHHWGFVMK